MVSRTRPRFPQAGSRRRRPIVILAALILIIAFPWLLTYEIRTHSGASLRTKSPESSATSVVPKITGAPLASVTTASTVAAKVSLPETEVPKGGGGVHHPRFPQGAAVPTPYRLDASLFSDRQKQVREGVRHAFKNYKAIAWGHDELAPLRKTYSDWGHGPGSGIGLTAIESLDTLWLTGLYDEFQDVITYLKTTHTFDKPVEVGIFETTIRVLGGLLSAYELSGEHILLDKAFDIGTKLFRCIEGRAVPYASVDLASGAVSNPGWLGMSQSLAEVTTIQLEFKKLSQYTGIKKFDEATTAIMRLVLKHTPQSGLFPIYISMHNGAPASGVVTLGARGDSFYEYLAKQWALTNFTEGWLKDAYEKVSNGIVDNLVVQMDDQHAFVAESNRVEVPMILEYKMDHLVCFVVGMLELGKHGATATKHSKAAADIARTCYNIYESTPTHLGVEIVRFRDNKKDMFASPGAHHYIMRPEVMEAMFYMQRFHPEDHATWGEKAWSMYMAMEKHLKVENGWVGLEDATILNSGKRDKMESFFVAETLKYAFLCAAPTAEVASKQLPLSEWVFNTEAHPLRVLPGPLS